MDIFVREIFALAATMFIGLAVLFWKQRHVKPP
jgi:hypothetical protein